MTVAPVPTRCNDTIHIDASCPSLRHAKNAVAWVYADGMNMEQVEREVAKTPWLKFCLRCWATPSWRQ